MSTTTSNKRKLVVPMTSTTGHAQNQKKKRGKVKLKGYLTYTVKQGLKNTLKLPLLAPFIHDLVESVSLWKFHVFNLLHLDVQRCLDQNLPVRIDQTFVDQAFAIITHKENDEKLDRQLKYTYDIFYKNVFQEVPVPLERTGAAVFACLWARREFLTAAKNNISVHFYTRHSKWIRLMLIQYLWKQIVDQNPDQTIKDLKLPKLGKMVYSIYKVSVALDDPTIEDILPESKENDLKLYCLNFIQFARGIIKKGELDDDKSRFPITEAILQQRWCEYLPWMRQIITDFQKWQMDIKSLFEEKKIDQKTRNKLLKGFKLFSIIPQAKIGLTHVTIDNRVLFSWLKQLKIPGLPKSETQFVAEEGKWWNIAFKGHEEKKRLPSYMIKTDGVAVSVIYLKKDPNYDPNAPKVKKPRPKKKRKKSKKNDVQEDKYEEIKFTRPPDLSEDVRIIIIGLDPGKRDIFATSSGEGGRKERLRSRMSGTEYRISSGEVDRRKKANKLYATLKSIIGSDYKVLTHKVATAGELLNNHFPSIAQDFGTVWQFRAKKRERRSKFDAYIRSNAAIDRACERILRSTNIAGENNEAKVVVAFGQARFHGTKGCPTAPTKRLYHRLSTVHKRRCWVLDTDEYGTSKMCPRCEEKLFDVTGAPGDMATKKQHPRGEEGELEANKLDGKIIYPLKACLKCFTVCDRDVDIGAYNIYRTCQSLLRTGHRPHYMRRRPGGIGDLDTIDRFIRYDNINE